MSVLRFFIAIGLGAIATGSAYSLEYLSDKELEKLDGYTSNTLVKEYDDDGNIAFRRKDLQECRYDQNEKSGDTRARCEREFEDDNDRILAENFDRYLRASEALLEEPGDFDDPTDGVSFTTITGFSDGEDAPVPFCDVDDSSGFIYLEDIVVQGVNGGELEIGPAVSRIERQEIQGRQRSVIISETAQIEGIIGVGAIRIGITEDRAIAAPSLGGVFTNSVGSSTLKIYRSID